MLNNHLSVVQRFGVEIEGHTQWPRPHCPTCRQGFVSWEEPIAHETNETRNLVNEEGFEPEWISGTMHAVGHCENGECAQVVNVVGSYRVDASSNLYADSQANEYQGEYYTKFFKFEYFNPPLILTMLPEGVPQGVREAIDRASRILFADPSFAATALRGSVERFLTGEDIPATNEKGHRTSLHKRIELWEEKTGKKRVADQLNAVKWIGNEGTHEGIPLTVRDVLDGLEFMESAFHELLVAPEIEGRVRAVNLAKGRVKVDAHTTI